MTDIQQESIFHILENFREKASEKAESSAKSYNKALRSLEIFSSTRSAEGGFLSQQFLADWYLSMRVEGLSNSTSALYFDIISALASGISFSEIDAESSIDKQAFANVKRAIKDLPEPTFPVDKLPEIINKTRKLIAKIPDFEGEKLLAADIFLFSLLNGALPLKEVALAKLVDYSESQSELQAIIKRNASARRKYLFNLNQSSLTLKQLVSKVEDTVSKFLKNNNLFIGNTAYESIGILWAGAALTSGFAGSQVVAALKNIPEGFPELSLCQPSMQGEEVNTSIQQSVAARLVTNPLSWYAMRLRPYVKYEEVTARLNSLESHIKVPELFYPYEEIARRIGKKLIHSKKPVIRDVVFFKSRASEIFPLFCQIGDLAWCYTVSGRPGSDYASIPTASFKHFQETIGHFTPDYEITPISNEQLREGETVVVLNGLLAHQEFDIEKVENKSNAVFRLYMAGENGIQWRTTLKGHQLKASSK